MDDSEDETRYPSKYYSMNRQAIHNYSSSSSKPPKRNPHFYTQYRNDDVVDDEDDDEFEQECGNPQDPMNGNRSGYGYSYNDESKRHPKKRRLGELSTNYEFAPRAAANHGAGSSRGSSWSEEESFVLLEVWGERYLELGRRSLRGEDWVEVAEKVSEMSGVDRDVMECRNQLDVLKKKYKKERAKMEQFGGGFVSKWVFFKKLDVLFNLKMRGHGGLGCGVDSGEYVFMNPRVYLDRSNAFDEMRDSPAESDEDNEEEEEDGVGGEQEEDDGQSAKLLAESIQRFGEIYEKIEASKRKQMMELENMRRDFERELEMQKKEIVDKAQSEIAKLREMENDDESDDADDGDDIYDDGSSENLRG